MYLLFALEPPSEPTPAAPFDWGHVVHVLFYENTGLVLSMVLLAFLAVISRPPRWPTLRLPTILLICTAVLRGLGSLLTVQSSVGHFLHASATFCLLAADGRILYLILLQLVFERLRPPLSRIALDIVQMGIFVTVFVVVLHDAGVEPSALFTGSAVLTGVIGLAMRDTLGNLIAGLTIQAQQPFQVGDWIQYDQNTYHVGKVLEVNWRATKVITLDKAEVILPNGVLAQAFIRNFTKPEVWSRRSVYVVAPYDVPPNRVRQVILEAIADSWGVLAAPAPSVVTNEFKERGIEYWVRFFTPEFDFRDKVDGGVRDRIWYAFARQGITMPVATHEVRMLQLPAPVTEEPDAMVARRVSHLQRIAIFTVLSAEALHQLAVRCAETTFAAGETVIRQGDQGESLYLVERGTVAVTARPTPDQPAVEVARLGADAIFGEMSLLTGQPRTATITAVNECRLLVVDKAAFETVLRATPDLAERISSILAERQGVLTKRLSEVGESNPNEATTDLFQQIRKFFSL